MRKILKINSRELGLRDQTGREMLIDWLLTHRHEAGRGKSVSAV
jgi:hypothetical protein